MHGKKGFTLIELLVVISIIAFIVTGSLITINNTQKKGRDARRMGDIKQLQTALELFFDKYGNYPAPVYDIPCGYWDVGNKKRSLLKGLNGDGTTDPLKEFMQNPPVDPSNTAMCYYGLCGETPDCGGYKYFRYNAGSYGCDSNKGQYYVLGITNLESVNWPSPSSPGFKCSGRDWQNEFDWVTGKFRKN